MRSESYISLVSIKGLENRVFFDTFLQPLRRIEWVVSVKEPFAGPKEVLAYLSRYTHRIANSNSRMIRFDAHSVTCKVKDYRLKGASRHTTMTLTPSEFIRRFLIHVLPRGSTVSATTASTETAAVPPISLGSGNYLGSKRQTIVEMMTTTIKILMNIPVSWHSLAHVVADS